MRLGLAFVVLVACIEEPQAAPAPVADDAPDPYNVVIGPYEANIRWTTHGIPHITADGYGSLGYGMGYAFARDHACVLADQVVMVRSERSLYFGDS